VINAIGLTKPHIRDGSPVDVVRAIEREALLPHRIGERATAAGARVLQIATDGVYGGAAGPYEESAPHDAGDVYGQTKSLGETWHEHVHYLRCSIIGPEWRTRFLVEWFRASSAGPR
jgi:dTDP-4-dehydrorhamnose reductase